MRQTATVGYFKCNRIIAHKHTHHHQTAHLISCRGFEEPTSANATKFFERSSESNMGPTLKPLPNFIDSAHKKTRSLSRKCSTQTSKQSQSRDARDAFWFDQLNDVRQQSLMMRTLQPSASKYIIRQFLNSKHPVTNRVNATAAESNIKRPN